MKNKTLLLLILILTISFYLTGCVNVNQKTTIYKDGSGIIKLEYWTLISNVKTTEEIAKFTFKSEDDIKAAYSSQYVEVTSVKMEDNLEDSTRHVFVEMSFKDFNLLNTAKGFSSIQSAWKTVSDVIEFKYVIPQDTANANIMDAYNYKLFYEFEFPDDVISTNGRKCCKNIYWDKSLADLKKDLEFIAMIKDTK
jgi:hypothetical protein